MNNILVSEGIKNQYEPYIISHIATELHVSFAFWHVTPCSFGTRGPLFLNSLSSPSVGRKELQAT